MCIRDRYYTPSGRRNDSTKYLLCGSAVNLILNLCLIGKYGANGAAFASVVAELSITFLYVKNCNGFMKLGNLLRCMYKKIVAGLLMFFVVIGLENYLHVSKLMVLICQVVIGIATVSYTHLDVYKRQVWNRLFWAISLWIYQMVVYKSEKGTDTSRLFFFQRWIYDGSGISAIRIRCGV